MHGIEVGCDELDKGAVGHAELHSKCVNHQSDFSKNIPSYIDSITEFYNDYPTDRDITPEEILGQLGQGMTLEQIHHFPFFRRKITKD